MDTQYTSIARLYDRLNTSVDYKRVADFLLEKTAAYSKDKKVPELLLDLACGTGKLTSELARRGYDMTGIDLSEEMLQVALDDARREGLDILYLCQDMREFELYGTVGAVFCCFDSLNYITSPGGLKKVFSLVHNYLDPDGIFIFDMNTEYKFENVYSDNCFVLEEDGVVCVWQNCFNPKTKMCDFYLTFFEERNDGSYVRSDEEQRERCYSRKTVEKYLSDTGFELLEVLAEDRKTPAGDSDDRHYFIARAKK